MTDQDHRSTALLVPAALGGGAELPAAVVQVSNISEQDPSAGFALGRHHAVTVTLRTLGDPAVAAAVDALTVERGALWSDVAAADALGLAGDGAGAAGGGRLGLRGVPDDAIALDGLVLGDGTVVTLPPDAPLLDALRALFDAAVAVGLTRGSVAAATAFTRARSRPRPLPGVERATADPFSQTLIGAGHVEAAGASALVDAVALEAQALLVDAAAGPSGEPRADGGALDAAAVAAVRTRADAAVEIALTTALRQGEEVFEVVGTSGAANAHGFDGAWRDARALAALHPRAARRRRIGAALLAA